MSITALSGLQRYVKYHDLILVSDHNDLRKLAIALVSRFELINVNYELTELEPLVDKMKNKVGAIREVKTGEYVLADDHNCFVELAGDIYGWCEKASEKIGLTPETLTELKVMLDTLEIVEFGDIISPEHHNRLVKFYAELLPKILPKVGLLEVPVIVTTTIITPPSLDVKPYIKIEKIKTEVTGYWEAWNYPPYTTITLQTTEAWNYPIYTALTLQTTEGWNYPIYTTLTLRITEGWEE